MFSEIQISFQRKLGLDQVTLTSLRTPLTIHFYEKWLQQNFFGSMSYLKDHFPLKADATRINSQFCSVISITQPYFPVVKPAAVKWPSRVALYAQNDDYHFWLKEKLLQAIQILQSHYPNEIFAAYVDSGPILEKDYAYQAGHGWFGKNSCLIHPQKGSLFFVAEILTSLKAPDEVIAKIPDMCGTCTRCMEICPTKAIIEPKVIKADQCISYLTIESKTAPPVELRSKINDWFFGCDLCQTVCPWNEKFFRNQKIEHSALTSTQNQLDLTENQKQELDEFLRMILTSSNKKLQRHFEGTALHRAGGFGLKRNALIVIANRKIKGFEKEIEALLKDEKISELADWALKEVTS